MLQVYEFDPAAYLTDEAAVEAYLAAALERGQPDEIAKAEEVAARARLRLRPAGLSPDASSDPARPSR